MTSKRIRYFDFLRVIAFGFIIFYHMIVQLNLCDFYTVEEISKFYENANLHIATLGVACFFMLSGAGLMLSTRDGIELKSFYKKRMTRLMIPFYLVYVLCVFMRMILDGQVHEAFPAEIPRWRIIFSVLGIDGLLKNYGIETFYNVGEWFLGAILIMYLLFPIFRKLLLKAPVIFLMVSTAAYIVVVLTYHSELPMHLSLLLKGYEFIVGMYFGYYLTKSRACVFLPAAAVFLIFVFLPFPLPMPEGFKVTIAAASGFAACSGIEPILQKLPHKALDAISEHTYEAYLVHHVVIFLMTPLIMKRISGIPGVIVCFAVELFIIIAGAIFVKIVSGFIIRRI